MFDELAICPYTGLRSFTEEESIYFKGRDEHIEEATKMLEKNKFLMLTGASGDGKSSLVYAGIIPNARAGFLKATYTNWTVADFRPERDPFNNLCQSLADAMEIPSANTVKSELSHGFSALIDLYKSSKLNFDQNSTEWAQADEGSRGKLKRNAGNLLVLVDQFEEFFTNPENYHRGTTSNDSALVINLLLETAKIALDENLPIYIVFTMRSDFIGQCSAFRGLPEYIGFSQFFVPRLNRQQLQEVIEEPASLSGNRISRRLTERLIHDVEEGVDQLPILQHALNQIWKAADDGNEEMDLLHYAMVGGMAESELPDKDQAGFREWFNDLPKVIQECYHHPGLQKVLDTHANKIYASAGYEYKNLTGEVIDDNDAHAIIRTTFSSLTKIDDSRAVRNRMTLKEITYILDRPHIGSEIVANVIAIFRKSGNTFVKPFISEDDDRPLTPDAVLDITHESLIRNWAMLEGWAKEEFESFMILKDFKQQVDRWIEYDRSWGFLLPIGSLTYFENWFEETNPNPYWVNRYNELVTDTAKNIEESREIVDNSRDFLKRSGRKHTIARSVMRFGPKKIAAVFAVVVLLVLSSFVIYDQISKKNTVVFEAAISEGEELVNSDLTNLITRANYVINRERMKTGEGIQILSEIEDPKNRFDLAVATSQVVNILDFQVNDNEFPFEVILYAGEVAESNFLLAIDNKIGKIKYMAMLLELIDIADHNYYFNQRKEIHELSNSLSLKLASLVLSEVRKPSKDVYIKELNESIEVGLNHHAFSVEEIEEIIFLLSPFEEEQQVSFISSYYSIDNSIIIGGNQSKFTYNGLFQILGELYGAVGNWKSAIRSVDTLLHYQPRYEEYPTDAYSIGATFASYSQWEAMDLYYSELARRFRIEPYVAYRRTADRMGYSETVIRFRFLFVSTFFTTNSWNNPVSDLIADSSRVRFYSSYLQAIEKAGISSNEKEFALALYYKQMGIFQAKIHEDRNESNWRNEVNQMFRKSIIHFKKVDDKYLDVPVQSNFHLPESIARRLIYLYPDYRQITQHYGTRNRYIRFYTGAFIEYILSEGYFDEFYGDVDHAELVVNWINEYKNGLWDHLSFLFMANELDVGTLEVLHQLLEDHPKREQLNTNLLKFLLANQYFQQGEVEKAISISGNIDPVGIPGLLQEEWGFSIGKTFDLIKNVYASLALHDEIQITSRIMGSFINDANKIRLFDRTSIEAYLIDQDSKGNAYLDSAKFLINSLNTAGGVFGGFISNHSYSLYLTNKEKNKVEGLRIVNNLNSFGRIERAYRLLARAQALNGHYFDALSFIPNASPEERLIFINELIGSQGNLETLGWEEFERNLNFLFFFNGYSFGG